MSESTIRLATPADAPAIASVMVASFLATYRGIMPDPVLDRLDLSARTERWQTLLTEMDPADPKRVWVADDASVVRGYAVTVPASDEFLPPPEGAGELDSLYVHPDAVGRGLGRRLLAQATDDLRERGFDPLILWAFTANTRARSIYEAAGWIHDADHHWVLDEVPVPIVRYRLARSVGR